GASALFVDAVPPVEVYPLSLHDALPIYRVDAERCFEVRVADRRHPREEHQPRTAVRERGREADPHLCGLVEDRAAFDKPAKVGIDRKSTRLNSSHVSSSYAVLCLKKHTN